MGNKEKGANAERELLKMFVEAGYMAVRVAGSGMLPEPSCDLLAGKGEKKWAIECKTCKGSKKYLDKEQIKRFRYFCKIFGLEPLLAIKFNRQGWFFLHPEKLERTGKGLAISLEAARRGLSFAQLVK